MLQLKLFGAPGLERDGVQLTGRASQRHRLALLALLAQAPGGRLSRDKLIALLWPESDAERSRNLLKVATYVLRSTLGDDALFSTGDDLRLNTDLVRVDSVELEAALTRTDFERAVTLYTGPFLDGFFLSEAPEFDHWVDRERDRLSACHGKALEALAEAAESAGDLPKAIEWWKARAVQDRYDSRVALRLMQALEAGGNRAGALQQAAVHTRLLQSEFGIASAPDVEALAERLRREPGPARDDPNPPVPATPAAADPGPAAPPTVTRRARRRWLPAAALLAVAVVAALILMVRPSADLPERSIVVLPFVNLSADPDNEYFSDGLTEEIIARLAAISGLKVISRTSAMHYKGTTKALPEIAKELGVDHILEGSVRQSDGRVRISAQLIDARNDAHLWAENYEHGLDDSFGVQDQIAQRVTEALEVRLGARERRLLVKQGTRDPEAYRLYQRARFLWNTRTREGHERAIEYFGRAIHRDSAYADAYAGLADAYFTTMQNNFGGLTEAELYSRLTWAAERALALDDESADAHVSFAVAQMWQRNWPGAAREFHRAIELNPGHATARSWHSLLLRGMGQSQDALRESRRAAELDPFAVVVTGNYASQCYVMRDYDCAREQLLRALEIVPYPNSWRWLGLVYAQKGMPAEALAAVHKAIELAPNRPDYLADLAYVQALANQTAEARESLRRAKAEPWEGFSIARAHAALGEADSAFAWLDKSTWRWPHRAARDDPGLDRLRGDPRFARLVLRVSREMGMQ